MEENQPLNIEVLKKFEPLSTLSDERLTELAGLTFVEKLNIGVNLFSEGDIDGQTVYLVDGDVQGHQCAVDRNDKECRTFEVHGQYTADDQPKEKGCNQ